MRIYAKLFFVCLIIQAGSIFAADDNQPISGEKRLRTRGGYLSKPIDVNQPDPNVKGYRMGGQFQQEDADVNQTNQNIKEIQRKIAERQKIIMNSDVVKRATEQERKMMEDFRRRKEEHNIERSLCEAVVSWLADANEAAGKECDRFADSLLSIKEPEPSVKAYFTAAQVARLRGKQQKAISIIEDVITKHPYENAEMMNYPVRIFGRFWIGAIARHGGDMTKAKDAYETILKDINENLQSMEGKETLAMMCGLYLAEIESSQKRNDAALSRLEAVKQIKRPEGQWAAPYEMLVNWAAYQHSRISEGKKSAERLLVSYPESVDVAGVYPITIMALGGMVGEPLAGCGAGPGVSIERANIAGYVSIKRVLENKNSEIDRDLARLTGGLECLMSKEFTGAEKYYSELFAEDSYFSPMAGIYLASCKIEQGNIAEGNAILDKVKAKYPGYESTVNKLRIPQK
jgi:tetratricopeptide (TPR) repeat protein